MKPLLADNEEHYTLFLDMYCWWTIQRGYWGRFPNEYGVFKCYTEALECAAMMNAMAPTALEKSLCRWVSESRPRS